MLGHDLLVAALRIGSDGRQFQAIQRTLAGQRLAAIFVAAAILAGRIGLADQNGQERIESQGIVVIEVFVAQGQGEDALGEQIVRPMFDPLGIAVIGETGGESAKDAGLGLHLPQQESAGVRSDGPAVESGGDCPASEGLEIELACVTLCHHRAASLCLAQVACDKTTYATEGRPFSIGVVRNAG